MPQQKRILVADSDEIVAFIVAHVLTTSDFAIERADRDGVAGKLVSGRYDAIVLGDALISANDNLRQFQKRVIVLGGPVDSLKPFAVLRKPLEIDLLVATVRACAQQA